MACDTIKSLVTANTCVTAHINETSEEKLDWKDTNVGKIGSDEDKAVRKEAASREAAWATAGRKTGIDVWRVEAFNVVAVDPEQHGKFYEGDSYIILKTMEEDSGKLSHDIHFLIGKDSTADEYGTAAYKTVELDDYFSGEPTEYREHQTEGISDKFKEIFPALEWLEGGNPGAFKHVLSEHENVLYQVREHKGKVMIFPVPLNTSSLHPDDSFILDGKKDMYIYHGPQSNGIERETAEAAAAKIKKDREATEMVGSLETNISRLRLSTTSVTDLSKMDSKFWEALEGDKPSWVPAAKPEPAPAKEVVAEIASSPATAKSTYSLEELQNGCPPGVAPDHKQDFLSDEDFKTALGMTRDDFSKLPAWKQQNAKKAAKIF